MAAKTALVFGGCGALGNGVMQAFTKANWKVYAVSLSPCVAANLGCTVLPRGLSLVDQQEAVLADVSRFNFHAVINCAGGWAGGDISSPDTAAAAQLMLEQSLYSSFIAAHIASKRGQPGAFLALPGSAAALSPTPGMIGYGVAKAAVHALVKSIAADPHVMPPHSTVIGYLPTTIDTPANRAAMPNADFASWTPVSTFSSQFVKWAEKADERPANGSLVVFRTAANDTKLELH